jgi:hypothetical protein
MGKDSIAVHVLSRVVSCQEQPSETDSDVAKEDATFLSRGRAIAHAGCDTNGWQIPKPAEPLVRARDCGHHSPYFPVLYSPDLCLGRFKNAYTYLPAPPPVPTAVALASGIVKDWGTRPSESERFSTADLDPFESMSFCSLRPWPPVGDGDSTASKESRDRRWSQSSSSPSRPPTKRAKVEVETGPLDELIPPVLDDPSRDVVLYAYDDPPSPITFPPLSSHWIPHCPLDPPHWMFTLLSCRSRHKPHLLSRLSSRPCMPALPG